MFKTLCYVQDMHNFKERIRKHGFIYDHKVYLWWCNVVELPPGGAKVIYIQFHFITRILTIAGMGVFSFARYDDNFYSRTYAGRLKKRLLPKQGDYSVFDGYYTPPITSTLLLRSCKVSNKHAPPLTQFWYYEPLSGPAKGPSSLYCHHFMIKQSILLLSFFYQQNLMLNIYFPDNDPWDRPYVWSKALPVVELRHAGFQPPGGVWSQAPGFLSRLPSQATGRHRLQNSWKISGKGNNNIFLNKNLTVSQWQWILTRIIYML